MKSAIGVLFFFVGYAYSMPQTGRSCLGCFGEADMNEIEIIDDIKAVAVAESATLIIGNLDENCRVKLDSLTNFQRQIVAGTKYKFDAIFKWEGDCEDNIGRQTTCRNFLVFEPLYFRCDDAEKEETGYDSCLELMNREEIECEA